MIYCCPQLPLSLLRAAQNHPMVSSGRRLFLLYLLTRLICLALCMSKIPLSQLSCCLHNSVTRALSIQKAEGGVWV